MTLSDRIQRFFTMLEITAEDECDCSHVFQLMDEAVELQAQGVDLAAVMPRIEQHLLQCLCCRDEFETLKRIVAGEVEKSGFNEN